MAASSAMQSILAYPVTGVIGRSRLVQAHPSMYVPRLQRNMGMQVRCMAEQEAPKEQATPMTPPPAPEAPLPTPPPPPRVPKVSTKFSDVFAFSGPAPERINGRLAMLGFVAAMAVELSSGQDVFEQISNGGVPLFLGTSILFTIASVIPLFKGVNVQSKYSKGVMTSDVELWNGRVAMLGLVALVFTEFVKGGALV